MAVMRRNGYRYANGLIILKVTVSTFEVDKRLRIFVNILPLRFLGGLLEFNRDHRLYVLCIPARINTCNTTLKRSFSYSESAWERLFDRPLFRRLAYRYLCRLYIDFRFSSTVLYNVAKDSIFIRLALSHFILIHCDYSHLCYRLNLLDEFKHCHNTLFGILKLQEVCRLRDEVVVQRHDFIYRHGR